MYGLGVSVLECVAWGCRCLSGMGVFRSWFIFAYFQDLILFNYQDLIGLGGFRSWFYELASIPLFTTTKSLNEESKEKLLLLALVLTYWLVLAIKLFCS